jgi:GntR family transcriptional regulator
MLNPQSPIPLYHQLSEILIRQIRTGDYPPGTKIPPETGLATMYAIGRPTVRQAIDLLVRKGLLVKKRGAGTFVRKEEKEVDLFSLAGTTAAFHQQGIEVNTRIVEKICLKKTHEDNVNPFSNQFSYFFSRLTTVENEPVLVEEIYLHPEIFPGIDKINLEGRSLAQIVSDHFYLKPVRGKQTFTITTLSSRLSQLLKLSKKESVLAVRRFLDFQQTENAIYSDIFCRTDRYVFSQTIGGIPND